MIIVSKGKLYHTGRKRTFIEDLEHNMECVLLDCFHIMLGSPAIFDVICQEWRIYLVKEDKMGIKRQYKVLWDNRCTGVVFLDLLMVE